MKPIRVEMSAFGSYATLETVSFEAFNHGIFLITGDTGAGKTTIFDAITYALYDETSGGKRDGNMMRSQYAAEDTPTYVQFTFQYHGQIYTIKRNPRYNRVSKKKNKQGDYILTEEMPSVELIMPDGRPFEGKVKETNKKITEIMGLDVNQFTQIAMIAQGEFLKLLHAPTKERKEIFSKIFDTKIYGRMQEELRNRTKALSVELDRNKNQCMQELDRVTCINGSQYEEQWLLEKRFSEVNMDPILALLSSILDEIKEKEEQLNSRLQENQLELDRIKTTMQLSETTNQLFDKLELTKASLSRWDEKKDYFLAIQTEIVLGKKALKVNQKEVIYRSKATELIKTNERIEKIKEVLASIEKDLIVAQQEKERLEAIRKEISQSMNPEITRIKDSLDSYQILLEKNQSLGVMRNTVDQSEAEFKKLLEKLEENKTQTAQLLEAQNSLKDAPNQAVIIEQTVKNLEDKAKQLQQMVTAKHDFLLYRNQLEIQAHALKTAHSAYLLKSESYEQLYTAFINEQVGIIAETLLEGSPCPVCGSLDHPNKALKSDSAVTQTAVDAAKKDRNGAQIKVDELNKQFNETKSKLNQEVSFLAREGRRLIDLRFSLSAEGLSQDNTLQNNTLQNSTLQDDTLQEDALQAGLNMIDMEVIRCNQSLKQEKLVQKVISDNIIQLEKNNRKLEELDKEANTLAIKKEKADETINSTKIVLSNLSVEVQGIKKMLPFETKQMAQEQLGKFTKSLEEAELDARVSVERYQTLINKKEENQGAFRAEETAKVRQMDELNQTQTSYFQELASQGFMEEKDYRQSYKEETILTSLEQEYQVYRDETIKLQEILKTYTEQTEGKARVDLSELKSKVADVTDLIKSITEQNKMLFSIKETNMTAAKQLTMLFKGRSSLKANYEVINNLDKTANGSLSGVAKLDFQTFIQRRYFEHIIHEANKRLHVMSGEQFVLRCRDVKNLGAQGEVGLDLDVYSMVNDKTRDVKTLSGGESFMASLSMALGMADVIQHTAGKIHIDTMFIDEGFGSLDEDTREQAIQILNGLAEGKRLVGIISHVTELKERIGQKLIVTKDEKGSKIHWEQQ